MRKSDITRRYIVERTAPVFNRKGFAGTSLNDLTAATGLSKGAIYGNFSGKDEVALAAFDHNLSLLTGTINREIRTKDTAYLKLMVFVTEYPKLLKIIGDIGGCPILNTSTDADDTHPLLRKKAAKAVRDWKMQIVRIIEEGVLAGEFREDAPAEDAAIAMIALIEGGVMITRVCNNSSYFGIVMREVHKQIESLR